MENLPDFFAIEAKLNCAELSSGRLNKFLHHAKENLWIYVLSEMRTIASDKYQFNIEQVPDIATTELQQNRTRLSMRAGHKRFDALEDLISSLSSLSSLYLKQAQGYVTGANGESAEQSFIEAFLRANPQAASEIAEMLRVIRDMQYGLSSADEAQMKTKKEFADIEMRGMKDMLVKTYTFMAERSADAALAMLDEVHCEQSYYYLRKRMGEEEFAEFMSEKGKMLQEASYNIICLLEKGWSLLDKGRNAAFGASYAPVSRDPGSKPILQIH